MVVLKRALYGHPESGPIWDKKMHSVMKQCGFLPIEGSPGVFYHPSKNAEMIVYVDDFILIAPEQHEADIWKELDKHIEFKDPAAPITRFLGVNHEFKYGKDGSVHMLTSAKEYLRSAVDEYMKEIGVKSLKWVPTPSLDDRFDEAHAKRGAQADTALSHLMKIMYIGRLCRGDVLVTTTFLARRINWWSLNEDKRLHRLMSYISHHLDLCLNHCLNPADAEGAFLEFSPDAELGGDPYTTKASGGYWLELSSPCGERKWPICFGTKKAGHTSGSTADSETWSLIGTHDAALKRDVIPLLHQIEITLGRPVKLVGKEDNTACIAAVKRGYSPALRYLQRHAQVSLGFAHEVFHPEWEDNAAPKYLAELAYWESKSHKGDWMTKELPPKDFCHAVSLAGFVSP